jgi:ribosomal protein S18 acetylase RimI-like enzyme
MLVLDSNNNLYKKIDNHKTIMNFESYEKFTKILQENKITELDFVQDDLSSVIFIDDKNFYLCQMRDLAGLRLLVLNDSNIDFSLLNEMSWKKLEFVAQHIGADLIQISVPYQNMKKIKPIHNVFMENYVFEKNIHVHLEKVIHQTTQIDFKDKQLMQKIAELEFLTRIKFPSSSFGPKDNFSDLLEEYKTLADFSGCAGISIDNDPTNGFIVWWSNLYKKSAIVIHMWVSENYRGQGCSQDLLNAMMSQLALDNINECRYFVSATNIGAIKSLFRSGFILKFFVLNKIVIPRGHA